MYFRNYGLPKTLFGKYVKSAVSQYPSTSNSVNTLKHCKNLHGATFTIFIDHYKGYSVWKNHS